MRSGITLSAVALAIGLMASGRPAEAAGSCTDNWSDMAGEVAANRLTPPKDLQQLAKAQVAGKLIKVSLCKAYGGYQYQLVFLDASGQIVNLAVDARQPFPQ